MLVRCGGLGFVAILMACTTAHADQKLIRSQVPRAVLVAFARAYPRATVRGYGLERENGLKFYEIESVEGGSTRDILYRPDGAVAEIEEEVASGALPAGAARAIEALKPRATIRKIERVVRGDTARYEVHLLQGKKKSTRVFDSAGRPAN